MNYDAKAFDIDDYVDAIVCLRLFMDIHTILSRLWLLYPKDDPDREKINNLMDFFDEQDEKFTKIIAEMRGEDYE